MRFGIDYRLLSAGRAAVHCGIGRYTQQQLREVLRLDGRNAYVLFCRKDTDVDAILPEISAAPNVSIAWLPALAGRTWEDLNQPAGLPLATAELQRAIAEQEVDVFHATTPCYLADLVPSRLDVCCPLVATHYDLIPLLFPQHYLVHGPFHRSLYLRALDLIRQADRVIAISEHVRREALEHLGVPLDRSRIAHPIADPCFRPLPEEERERILAPLRERLRLDGEFLLCVSQPHHSKNLPALFEACRRLPAPMRRRLPLVLAGGLGAGEEETVRLWAREAGIEDGLVLTGFLPDRELVALYNAAAMVVHPSRYEGFGLPVLEAMRCGAAVIAGNATSLPEVAGDAGLLVDPEDPAALARAIEMLAGDPSLRREMGERAIERAARFRPEDLGHITLEIYEEVAREMNENERARAGRGIESTRGRLPYNKACGLEDFADPELVAVLRDVYAPQAERSAVYPAGAEHRKYWEVAMSVRALRDFGALRPDAEILGVGAGSEITVFYLTRHARRVVVTDLYLAPGEEWETVAPPLMMVAPERLSPIAFERERLEVLHMDGRWLRFPENSFDGIFSSGSIEHFGDFEDISAAACEMARVLKPGGVLTLSTELLLEGPPGSMGWPGTVLLSPERLRRHIIEASGLEPVDPPDLAVSPRTLDTRRDLLEAVNAKAEGRSVYPHLLLIRDGQLFGSVHLTLRKTEPYPVADNAWARPSEELRARVRRSEAEAEKRLLGAPSPAATPAAPSPAAAPPAPADQPDAGARLEEAFCQWDMVRARSSLQMPEQGAIRRALGFLRRTALRVRDLGVSWDRERDLFRALSDRQTALDERLRASEEARAALAGELAELRRRMGDVLGAINELRATLRERRQP